MYVRYCFASCGALDMIFSEVLGDQSIEIKAHVVPDFILR